MAIKEDAARVLSHGFTAEVDTADGPIVVEFTGADLLRERVAEMTAAALAGADLPTFEETGDPEFDGLFGVLEAPLRLAVTTAITPNALAEIRQPDPRSSGKYITAGVLLGGPIGWRLGKAMGRRG